MINRKIYLVDTENCGQSFVPLIEADRKTDMVKLFYSPHSGKFDLGYVNTFQNWECDVECIKLTKVGKNQLDFQLSTYLGYLIKRYPKSIFIIISNDRGFESVVDFWKERGYNILVKLSKNTKQQNQEPDSIETTATETKIDSCSFIEYMESLDLGLDVHTLRRIKAYLFTSKNYISFKNSIKQMNLNGKTESTIISKYRFLLKLVKPKKRK